MAFPNLDKLKGSVEKGVKAAQKGASKLDAEAIGKAVEEGIKVAQKGVQQIDAEKAAEDAKRLASFGTSGANRLIGKLKRKPAEEKPATFKEFIALLWYLANTDESISAEEERKITQIALSLDEQSPEYMNEIARECAENLSESRREFGAQSAAKIEAQKLIESLNPSARDAKLLCWNLLAVANADGLDDREADFIRFVSEKAGLGPAAFEELRNYSDAIVEIESARKQLKESNRIYAIIEPLVNELAEREQKIIQAAQALISDN